MKIYRMTIYPTFLLPHVWVITSLWSFSFLNSYITLCSTSPLSQLLIPHLSIETTSLALLFSCSTFVVIFGGLFLVFLFLVFFVPLFALMNSSFTKKTKKNNIPGSSANGKGLGEGVGGWASTYLQKLFKKMVIWKVVVPIKTCQSEIMGL